MDTNNQKRKMFITGAAGYIGGMLVEQLSEREDVKEIICLDKEIPSENLRNTPKTLWFNSNTSDDDWRRDIRAREPDTIIHCAWQIRELYGKRKKQWRLNVEGSKNIFDFAFSLPSVQKIIYTSTASSYGAFKGNTLDYKFSEEDNFREKEYLYGFEKKVVEETLEDFYKKGKESKESNNLEVFVLRLGSVTGPRGRSYTSKFGLMPALGKRLPKGIVYRLISIMVTFIPATPKWCRQFVHEDDVTDIIKKLSLEKNGEGYEILNVAPAGKPVLSKDLADILNRKRIFVPAFMIRFLFFLMRHLTKGKITTTKGGWRFYCYPILMDGSKLMRKYGHQYKYSPREALEKYEGRYAT